MRDSLAKEMDGSAARKSGTENSEWLHALAHSLGGKDKAHNLMAGPHSLNTAMIPFETCVKELVALKHDVNYMVVFFAETITATDDSELLYIHHIELGIKVKETSGYWTLTVDKGSKGMFIRPGPYQAIRKFAEDFRKKVVEEKV